MHIHSLSRAALAACVVAVAAISNAAAATIPAELRVEAGGGQDLTHGWTYFSDTATLTSETDAPCNGKGESHTIEGATALGILEHARAQNDRLDPIQISDQFDFGLLVCGIGGFVSSDTRFWTYKVNHVAPEVGAEQYPLKPGDDVLWTLQDTTTGANTGAELELIAPRTVTLGEAFEVTVNEYDFVGSKAPAAGVAVGDETTDENGKATITLGGPDRTAVLRAYRGTDVPSAPVRVCVGECLRTAQKRVFGTAARDVINAREELAEFVYASGGEDRIDVRGDSYSDKVRCGGGRDRVFADEDDRVARDCERVTRR